MSCPNILPRGGTDPLPAAADTPATASPGHDDADHTVICDADLTAICDAEEEPARSTNETHLSGGYSIKPRSCSPDFVPEFPPTQDQTYMLPSITFHPHSASSSSSLPLGWALG
jgi:hypothetical protein